MPTGYIPFYMVNVKDKCRNAENPQAKIVGWFGAADG